MSIAKGPRPWSIHAFAAAFLGVAVIGLGIALWDPALEGLKWAARVPAVTWSEDSAIIAAFSVFTMALFPLVWIYGFGALRARWVVLGFAVVKIGLWWHGMTTIALSGWIESVRWLEPALIVLALVMMFAPASTRWLKQNWEADAETLV